MAGEKSESALEEGLLHFKTKCTQFQNALSKILTMKPLKSDQLLSHCHFCLSGLPHAIKTPKVPFYLDQYLSTQDFLGGFAPQVGEKHIAVVAINSFPLESTTGMLQALSELPIAFRFSLRFIFMGSLKAGGELKKRRRYWFQKRFGFTGLIKEIFQSHAQGFLDQDALAMTQDADQALHAVDSGAMGSGYLTCSFILMEKEEEQLEECIKLLFKLLESRGFTPRVETINAIEAYLGSLPGHGYQNIRKPILSTLNLADFLSLNAIWKGQVTHPCPYYLRQSPPLFYAQTQGKTPFSCSLHVDDVGHTLVIGDTGSGKSTLLGFLMTQHLRYPSAQIFMFDKGYSSFTLCHALGGSHYDIANDGLCFAPLQNITNDSEMDWACEWLETLYESQGLAITPLHRAEIRDSLLRLRIKAHPTLSDLQTSLQHPELKLSLEFYTLSGAMGQLLDAEQDDFASGFLHVFEMQQLLNKEEKFAIPVLNYLFHQINQRLAVNKPSLIIIEEGHRFLKGYFGAQLEVWLRECRKHNTSVIFVTQSLAEVHAAPSKAILLNSCPTRIFLPNINALAPYNQALYQELGLTEQHLQLIAQSTPKQDYFLMSPLGNRLMDLVLSKTFLTLMESTTIEERQHILQLKAQYQEQWVPQYFNEKGLIQEANRIAALNQP